MTISRSEEDAPRTRFYAKFCFSIKPVKFEFFEPLSL